MTIRDGRGLLRLRPAVWLAILACACNDGWAGRVDREVRETTIPQDGQGREGASAPPQSLTPGQAGESLIRTLGCAGCHPGLPSPAAPPAPPIVPQNLDAGVVFTLLSGAGPTPVRGRPHPGFHLDEREVVALTVYLGGDLRNARDRGVRAAARRHPDATGEAGSSLYAALACGACHGGEGGRAPPNGPSLALEGTRVRPAWLRSFLRAPFAIRPSGVRAGDGGRMPDFSLDESEADRIAAYLESLAPPLPAFVFTPPTAFSAHRTAAWVTSRLSCTGCHTLGGSGGRIGPDLSRASVRLRPEWIRAMLDDPNHLVPGTIMPAMPGTAEARDRVATWLASGAVGAAQPTTSSGDPAQRAGYLSLLDTLSPVSAGDTEARDAGAADARAESLYRTWCAACHGMSGRGDGYNAAYLEARPADHTDAAAMGERPDDTLYDAIAAGAFFLDRSPSMPGFGSRLTPADIRALVAYIRTLCACAQPAWAADGRGSRAPGGDSG